MVGKRQNFTAILTALAMLGALAATASAGTAAATCFGRTGTIMAVAGVPTEGTSGPDVIIGTSGNDVINGRGGADRICSRGGDDDVRGGSGNDRINLGKGNDIARGGKGDDLIRAKSGNDTVYGNSGRDEIVGGPGADDLRGGPNKDTIRGNSGSDNLRGNKSADSLNGGRGTDVCNGGGGRDSGRRCETVSSLSENLNDLFAGDGALKGYTTNNGSALPDVARVSGRYRANVTNNTGNVTLHFNGSQGRLDAKLLEFPFDVSVRNIGIGTQSSSQTAPQPAGSNFVFAGVQVHVTDLDDTNSSHVVVGHRGGTSFTIEGKNTLNGSSSVNDAGANIVPDGRADIRIVGNADRTLTVYWQTPNANPGKTTDNWILYNGTGSLPGTAPAYGNSVYLGLITYAFGSTNVPFVGTADSIEAS